MGKYIEGMLSNGDLIKVGIAKLCCPLGTSPCWSTFPLLGLHLRTCFCGQFFWCPHPHRTTYANATTPSPHPHPESYRHPHLPTEMHSHIYTVPHTHIPTTPHTSSELLVHCWTLGKIFSCHSSHIVPLVSRWGWWMMPLRPILHMFTLLRDFGQILVDPCGSDQSSVARSQSLPGFASPSEVGTSAPASVADCLAFFVGGRPTATTFAVAVLL